VIGLICCATSVMRRYPAVHAATLSGDGAVAFAFTV